FLLYFFLLLLRPPPTSPLFPYTTLFRSLRPPGCARSPASSAEQRASKQSPRVSSTLRSTIWPPRSARFQSPAGTTSRATLLLVSDRKSTRLNSSHDQISYAVFCLKKKNN